MIKKHLVVSEKVFLKVTTLKYNLSLKSMDEVLELLLKNNETHKKLEKAKK